MLIVTIAALIMAAGLGWLAFRLLREEQRRSDARVAVLTAALESPDRPEAPVFRREVEPVFPRGVAIEPSRPVQATRATAPAHMPAALRAAVPPAVPRAVAAARPTTPTVVMLDDTHDEHAFPSEQQQQPPRQTHMDDHAAEAVLRRSPREASTRRGLDDDPLPLSRETPLFASPTRRPVAPRNALIAGLMGLLALVVAGSLWMGRTTDTPAEARQLPSAGVPAAGPAARAGAGVPLELVTLGHEQRGTRLVVRGLVRNPVAGSERTGLLASVLLLDAAGQALGNGRASVDPSRLRPGGEGGFSVSLPSDARIRRYRVTFRDVDDALVAHQDRRPSTTARRSSR